MPQFPSLLACFPTQKERVQHWQLPGQSYFLAAAFCPDTDFFILEDDTPLIAIKNCLNGESLLAVIPSLKT